MDTGEVETYLARQVELLREMGEMTLALFEKAQAAHRAELGLDDEDSLSATASSETVDWAAFVDAHPELRDDDVALDDQSVLAALREALAERDSRGAAWAAGVASVLYGSYAKGDPRWKGRVSRVARRLSKLANKGCVACYRPKWGGGACQWTLPGTPVDEYIARYWKLERRGDDA